MILKLKFLPEVEEDAIAGYSWYEEKVRGLGEEFLRMFYACANELSRNAYLYQKIYGDFRRRLLRRFPYAIYFQIEEHVIVVFGLFHCARDPKAIRSKLSSRNN